LTYTKCESGERYKIEGYYTIKNVRYDQYLYDSKRPRQETLALLEDRSFPCFGYWKITRVTSMEFKIESPRRKYANNDYTINEPGRWEFVDIEILK
jgi:hypothetical protein